MRQPSHSPYQTPDFSIALDAIIIQYLRSHNETKGGQASLNEADTQKCHMRAKGVLITSQNAF